MTASEDIDNLVIVPPEKPLKMRAQPIMPPRVKRMWQKLWLKPREERREADRGRNGAGAREHAGSGAGDGRNRPALRPWYGAEYAMLVHRRRRLLSTLVIVTVALGLLKWAAAMPSDITLWTRAAVIVLFVLTFGWIALYFWSSILGFSQLLKRARMPGITYPADVEAALDAEAGIAADDLRARQNPAAPKVREMASRIRAKTAVLMPIYNEEPAQVMARLLAIGEDLQQAGAGGRFDIFVLSDTTNPKIWVKEEKIWLEAKRILESGSFGAESRSDTEAAGRSGGTAGGAGLHIYYRRRAQNTARKSGNIEDFCNRWGAEYDFMLVLDADSLMTAETIVKMARLMEANPHAGIIQASPQMVNSTSMFARMQQFAGKVAGPVVGAGLAYWQAGNSNYWGHNAIIRTRAFIDCCGLPKLKGKGPFGGFILSHDFVEAALIARGGWSAWLLPELKGSYEECPPSMIDFAARDRRWCQGNLQHIKVLISRGLHPVSRVHFLTGIMSYLSSPLWLLFLLAGLSMVLFREFIPPQYFGQTYSLFPNWPVFDKYGTIGLFVLSMAMLLVPKFLGLAAYLKGNAGKNGRTDGVCGYVRSAWNAGKSLGLEIVVSTLMAPVMMLFQSKFVFDILRGKSVGWNAQNRGDEGTSWQTAWQIHKWHTVLGAVTALVVWKYAHVLFWWLLPITLGLVLAVPLSVISSRVSAGRWLRERGWFVIPEEICEPKVLARAKCWAGILAPFEAGNGGLAMLQNDRTLRMLHCRMLPVNGPAPEFAPEVAETADAKLADGRLDDLTRDEEMWALYERAC
ncbi:MAG: glucans biosynthesis glucosyltransferase MdoH [Acetobacter sp.]|nr:glucans biosynthesis glucosyltransferase MdoH [Acetobacter sp.]